MQVTASVAAHGLGAPDASGRRRPAPVEGSSYCPDADTVILAIGQVPDLAFRPDDCAVTRQGNLAYDPETLETGRAGVFAAGDAATGPRSAIEAVAMGHRAAESIHRFLSGEAVGRAAHRPEGWWRSSAAVWPNAADGAVARNAPAWRSAPWKARIGDFGRWPSGSPRSRPAPGGALPRLRRMLRGYRCVDACKPGAIDALRETHEIEVGAVILAPGFVSLTPGKSTSWATAALPMW